ncbi:MAG: tryptophan-rich sensory protein [Parvibaculaceae bacterium]|nr:tryptophan-rich sensory protein [Parvibaculaceae bacterium]HBM87520.1 sensor histidine kinase [Rhodobiaceae bacterium]|tara:strand:+ start:266 stop:721 length:456 start_codon:yes stop_codon:yes gene_type:complete
MNKAVSFVLFLLVVMGGGIAIGTLTVPGEWYGALEKPFFNPPSWVFGPVWTVLYLMIAFVGWRIWHREDTGALKGFWVLQMGLNFLWSPIFFGAQEPLWALGVIVFLFFTLLLFMRLAWRTDRLSAVLFVPYAVWVGFATMLNGAIVLLNM